jgi:3-isopropylmalate/(R)-2-methylmalate dehydratase large subunit
MGQTITEQILSRVMSRAVAVGEVIYPEPDVITVHDWYIVNCGDQLDSLGVTSLPSPEKLIVSTDHEPVAVSPLAAIRQAKARRVATKFGITRFFDAGRGGHGHIFPIEMGFVFPGALAVAYDIHVTNFGAIGCLGLALGTEIVEVMACGSGWVQVPETLRVEVRGKLADGVSIRDAAQRLIHDVDPDLFDYSVVEFAGPAMASMSIDHRMTLCNTPIEMGAKSAICEVDAAMAAQIAKRFGGMPAKPLRSDTDAVFRGVVTLDLDEISPQVAAPPTPDNVVNVGSLSSVRVNHAFIGSCASSSLTDLRDAARILKGRRIAPHVRMIVTPGTTKIAEEATAEGLMEIFLMAGAMISSPGCGPCAAGRIGGVAPGEVSINTGTRNDRGRLGPLDADIYLASPLTVAASAITGSITDPRILLAESPAK